MRSWSSAKFSFDVRPHCHLPRHFSSTLSIYLFERLRCTSSRSSVLSTDFYRTCRCFATRRRPFQRFPWTTSSQSDAHFAFQLICILIAVHIFHRLPSTALQAFCSTQNNIFILRRLAFLLSSSRRHFIFTIFDSNAFHCSHKHPTVEQGATSAATAAIAVTDEAFVAFDRTNDEVPAPTVHLISKYSCDTTAHAHFPQQ